jgi:hypothetical protein
MTPPFGTAFVSIPVDGWDQIGEAIEVRMIATANPGDPAALGQLAEAPGPHFCKFAAGHGMAARRTEAAEAPDATLAWSFESIEPTLVEIVVD